jgi:hypothetical protein
MRGSIDTKRLIEEAMISLEAALIAAETIAGYRTLQPSDFSRLIELVDDASEVVAQLRRTDPLPPKTIFPNRAIAQDFIERHPPAEGHLYSITQDGAGRCAISIFKFAAHL